MRTSPSCLCCGAECEIFDAVGAAVDDYTLHFTELSGTWSYGDTGGVGYAETSGTAGIFLDYSASADTWHIRKRFRMNPGTASQQWRLAVGADVNNYLFLEINITRSGGVTYIQIRIGKNEASSVSYFSDAPYSTTAITFTAGGGIADANWDFYGELSLDEDGALTGALRTVSLAFPTSLQPVTARNITSLGSFAGIFVISITGTLRFSEVLFEHLQPVREDCEQSVQSCTRGDPLPEFMLELSDSSPASYDNYDGPCDFDCSKIIGSFTMAMPTSGAFFSDSNCGWREDLTDDFDNCSHVAEFVAIVFTMVRDTDPTSLVRVLTVSFIYSNTTVIGQFTVATFRTTTSVPMEEWIVDDWIDLPELGTTACNTSANIACRIKRTS